MPVLRIHTSKLPELTNGGGAGGGGNPLRNSNHLHTLLPHPPDHPEPILLLAAPEEPLPFFPETSSGDSISPLVVPSVPYVVITSSSSPPPVILLLDEK